MQLTGQPPIVRGHLVARQGGIVQQSLFHLCEWQPCSSTDHQSLTTNTIFSLTSEELTSTPIWGKTRRDVTYFSTHYRKTMDITYTNERTRTKKQQKNLPNHITKTSRRRRRRCCACRLEETYYTGVGLSFGSNSVYVSLLITRRLGCDM